MSMTKSRDQRNPENCLKNVFNSCISNCLSRPRPENCLLNGLDVDCLVEAGTELGNELSRNSNMIAKNPEKRERLTGQKIDEICQNLADPVLQSKGCPKKWTEGVSPPQKVWHNGAETLVSSVGDMARTDTKFIEEKVIDKLFSPKVVKKIVKDDREIEFEAEMSNLNSIKLEKRILNVEERHLHTAIVNSDVLDQWEASSPVADQWGTSKDEQVHDNKNISSDRIYSNSKLVPIKPKSKLSPKNLDRYVPKGGEPSVGPKIERHSQEMEGPNGGTTPPLTHEKFLMEHSKPSINSKKKVPPKSPNSGRKRNRGKRVTKKTSPKRENVKPELKLLFEKIRKKKKEREAERLISNEKNDEKTSLDEKNTNGKEFGTRVSESGVGPIFAQKSLFGAGPKHNSQGERQKSVRDIVNTLEKNTIKKDEKKPELLRRKAPNIERNIGKKIDILRIKNSPISKKSVTPTRKSKLSEKKSEKIIDKISDENLICEDNPKSSLKKEKMRTIQRTIRDIWGPDVSKGGPKEDH